MPAEHFVPGEPYSAKNIAYAREHGYIRGQTVQTSSFEAEQGFVWSNTRKLRPIAQSILRSIRSNAHICILGHGAGGETSHAFHLRPDVHIQSLGLTPVDPFYPMKIINGEQTTTPLAYEHSLFKVSAQNISTLRARYSEIFAPQTVPYIQVQHCVESVTDAQIAPGSIDVLYENCGYTLYAKPIESLATVQAALTLLRDDGIAYLPNTFALQKCIKSNSPCLDKTVCTALSHYSLITAQNHPLYPLLKRSWDSRRDRSTIERFDSDDVFAAIADTP